MIIETARVAGNDSFGNGPPVFEWGEAVEGFARRPYVTLIVALSMILGVGCDTKNQGKKDSSRNGKPNVVSTNYPLHFFVQKIGGDHVNAVFSVADDRETGDPAFWKPSSAAISSMQKADLIIANGAGYESWWDTVTLPESSVVRTADSFESTWIIDQDGASHQHGPDGDAHTHGTTAFTTWLDFDNAIEQAKSVCDALSKLQPTNKAEFEANFSALEKNLNEFQQQLADIAPGLTDQHLIGSHPVYQYLQESMNLKMHSVHFEPDAEPTAEQWAEFDKLLQENPTLLMLWEDEPTAKTRRQLEERGLRVVVFNPLGNQPERGDFMSGMQQNIDLLKDSVPK